MTRNVSLDMLRGYALVCIMLNHMPAGVLRNYTLTNLAVFDAAELFVLLSGFLVGLVWIKIERNDGTFAAQRRFARRALQVWWALGLGSVLLAAVSGILTLNGMVHTAVWSGYAGWLVQNPLGYIGAVMTLWMQPNLIDVLALYVLLMAAVPLVVPVMRRQPVVFIAGSLLLWWFARPLNEALPNEREGGGLLFNPFAWQLLFFSGVAMGIYRRPLMEFLRARAHLVTPVAIAIAAYSSGMVLFWRLGPAGKELTDAMFDAVGVVDKWTMDWVRYASVMAWAWLVAAPLAGVLARIAVTGPGRALSVMGRGGLVSFVACALFSVVGDALGTNPGHHGPAWRIVVDVLMILALWAVAAIWLNREWLLSPRAAASD